MDGNTTQSAEEKQIVLDTKEGIAAFFEHVEELRNFIFELAEQTNKDEDVIAWLDYTEKVYESIQSELASVLQIIEIGESITTETVAPLQSLYTELVSSRDVVASVVIATELESDTSDTTTTLFGEDKNEPAIPESSIESPYQKKLVTPTILETPEHKKYLNDTYKNPNVFESYMRRRIYSVEEPSRLDKLLKVKKPSVFFELLRDLTITEADELFSTRPEEIRELLSEKEMDYRMFVIWADIFYMLIEDISVPEDTTFAELIVLAELAE